MKSLISLTLVLLCGCASTSTVRNPSSQSPLWSGDGDSLEKKVPHLSLHCEWRGSYFNMNFAQAFQIRSAFASIPIFDFLQGTGFTKTAEATCKEEKGGLSCRVHRTRLLSFLNDASDFRMEYSNIVPDDGKGDYERHPALGMAPASFAGKDQWVCFIYDESKVAVPYLGSGGDL